MSLIIITYLGGVLTILSPCILPILPFVFSKSQGSFLKNGLPVLVGMALTFSILSGVALVGGEWIAHASETGRSVAMVLMSVFGLSLIFPKYFKGIFDPLTRLGAKLGNRSTETGLASSILVGMSTGLLWAPCAGPILGLVLTGAAAQGNVASSIGLLLSYSLGAATSLAVALLAGNKFFNFLKKSLGADRYIKTGLGIAVLCGVAIFAFNLDRTILAQISKIGTEAVENKLLSYTKSETGEKPQNSMMMMMAPGSKNSGPVIEGLLPELDGVVTWLNSKPLSIEDLRGHVVLIDFWTYSCINCLRTLPYVKAWNEKYKKDGLIVIGIHTPEFAFEKIIANVEKAIKDLGITYPVAVDNNYKLWNAFKNKYWPAHYFIDRLGRIRDHHFGEGGYDKSEEIIKTLLQENGSTIADEGLKVIAEGVSAQAGSLSTHSPETYLGYSRAVNFVGDESLIKDKPSEYQLAKSLEKNEWSLSGKWLVENERAISKSQTSKIAFKFVARDLHLVLGTSGKPVKFRVTIDGKAPLDDRGLDVNQQGEGQISIHKLYQLIRQKEDGRESKEHLFEIEFLSPGADVYAFTFG